MATGEDSVAAAEVVKACYEEYGFTWEPSGYHADLYDLNTYYLGIGDSFWVCEVGGRIMATCALERFQLIPGDLGNLAQYEGKHRAAGTDCSLERLYVHPEGRRMGIGAALFERTISEAQKEGRRALEIWSDKEFQDAHRLYQRYGAVVIGERICDDPDAAEEWGLVLKLQKD